MLNDYLRILFATVSGGMTIEKFAVILFFMLVFGFIVSGTYILSNKGNTFLQGYAMTLVVLPSTVMIIVMMVGNNFATALSLGGAFALIRFRSVASGPVDIVYVLFCMAIGLTGGMGLLLFSTCITVVLCLVMFLLQRFRYAAPKSVRKILKIAVPENFNYHNTFDDIIQRYATEAVQKRIRTTDLGSLFEITFELTVRAGVDEKAFIDELRARNGNLPIALVLGETQPQMQ